MKRFIRITGIIILILIIPIAYLFRPFASDEFDFSFDKEKLDSKVRFLKASLEKPDTIQSQPNIIIILADDLGKTDLPLYGNTIVETPNIDNLAKEGAVFTNGYITSPICSPSRAGLLTGRYQQRFGHELQPANRYVQNYFEEWIIPKVIDLENLEFRVTGSIPDDKAIAKQGLPLTEITLADQLKKSGYETAIIGKWHLGHNDGFKPLDRGFNYHYGFYEAFSWFADTTRKDLVNVRHKGIMDKVIWDKGNSGTSLKVINDKPVEENEYYTYSIAREANQFIDKNKSKPFFLYLPFNAPHTPFQALKDDVEKYQKKGVKDLNKAVYYAMITELDNAVGQILEKLKQNDLEKNTLIFFLSDNGGATYTKATDNAPLRGGKMSMYEGGLNVPFVMKWKGTITPGLVYNNPVSSLDIFTTAAAAAKSEKASYLEYDGVDLIPYLNGKKLTPPHPALYWRSGTNKAIRKDNWKLVINELDSILALYNLETDKSEKYNLANQNPAKVSELQDALKLWEQQLINPLWPSTGYYINDMKAKNKDRFTL